MPFLRMDGDGGSSSSAKRYLRGVAGWGDLASKNWSSPSGAAIGGTGGFASAGAGGVGSVIPRSWKTSSTTSARAGVAASAAIALAVL